MACRAKQTSLGGIMGVLKMMCSLILTVLFIVSCSVISKPVRDESVTPTHFRTLLLEADKHIGATIIIGGYILETKNSVEESTLVILQSPLGFGQEVKKKDHSEGRFIVVHKGFLEPEVYSKDRKITVAGVVIGSVTMKIDGFPHPHLKIRSREIFLWPEKQYPYYNHYYDPWHCPSFNCRYWHRQHPY
jgi:outer membrane lipoprotein